MGQHYNYDSIIVSCNILLLMVFVPSALLALGRELLTGEGSIMYDSVREKNRAEHVNDYAGHWG